MEKQIHDAWEDTLLRFKEIKALSARNENTPDTEWSAMMGRAIDVLGYPEGGVRPCIFCSMHDDCNTCEYYKGLGVRCGFKHSDWHALKNITMKEIKLPRDRVPFNTITNKIIHDIETFLDEHREVTCMACGHSWYMRGRWPCGPCPSDWTCEKCGEPRSPCCGAPITESRCHGGCDTCSYCGADKCDECGGHCHCGGCV